MRAAEELQRVESDQPAPLPPDGFLADRLTFPGGAAALVRAREVMSAVLTDRELPQWFIDQCVDDRKVQSCTLDRWSLRAWRFWLEADNRRWWWWAAEVEGDRVTMTVLVRAQPYLRGSLDWLFRAAARPA